LPISKSLVSVASMKISLRLATSADTEFARVVHHSAYREVVTKQFGTWEERLQDGFFEKGWRPGESQVIQVDGQDIGCLLQEIHDDYIQLVEVQILPHFQGRGIGSQIIERLIGDAAQRGIPLRLQVLKANRGQELYLRMGFVKTGETATHALMEYSDSKSSA
jgi:GNAT superfamily N-acetyltransferase